MDIQRFRELADAYGAQRRRWPDGEQPLYDRFAHSREGQTILAEAEQIDAFLDGWMLDAQPGDLELRILSAASGRNVRRLLPWISTGFLASAALGFAIGFTQPSVESDSDFLSGLILGNYVLEESIPL